MGARSISAGVAARRRRLLAFLTEQAEPGLTVPVEVSALREAAGVEKTAGLIRALRWLKGERLIRFEQASVYALPSVLVLPLPGAAPAEIKVVTGGKGVSGGRSRRPAATEPLRRFAGAAGVKTCQWPHGTPGAPDFHFCGAPAVPGRPYCAEHCAHAYVRVPAGSKDAAA